MRFSGVVFFLLAASTVLGWFVTRSGIAREAAELIASVSGVAMLQLLLVIALVLLLGTLLDVLPALVVSGPVLAPAMVSLGFDVHVAIVMTSPQRRQHHATERHDADCTAARIADGPNEHVIRETIPSSSATSR